MRSITTVEMSWSGVPHSTITTDRPEDFIKKLRMFAGRMGPPDDIRVSTRGVIRVLVDRSFGSAYYFWDYPGKVEDLEADWIAGRAPLNFYNVGWNATQFKGTIKEIPCRPEDSEYDCYAHVHGTDDTYLWSPDGRKAIPPEGWSGGPK
jgi:hypothetical protein